MSATNNKSVIALNTEKYAIEQCDKIINRRDLTENGTDVVLKIPNGHHGHQLGYHNRIISAKKQVSVIRKYHIHTRHREEEPQNNNNHKTSSIEGIKLGAHSQSQNKAQ